MVTVNEEILEHLPYIDIPITDAERDNVERLVRQELNSQSTNDQPLSGLENDGDGDRLDNINNTLHPMVDSLVPLPSPSSNLSHFEIERYEIEKENERDDKDDDDDDDELRSSRSIDLTRYDHDSILENLYYLNNQQTNLSLLLNNDTIINNVNKINDNVHHLEQDINQQLDKKRKLIDDINTIRNKRQEVDFKPVNDYLNKRWNDGIKSVVDLSIEASRLDM